MTATNDYHKSQKHVFNPWRKRAGCATKLGNYSSHFRNNFSTLYGKADFDAKFNIVKLLVGPYLACADALRVGGLTAAVISNNESHVGLLDYLLNPLGMLSLASIRLSNFLRDSSFEKAPKAALTLLSVAFFAFNIFIRLPLAIAATLTSLVTHLLKATIAVVAAGVSSVVTFAAEKISDRNVAYASV